MQLADNFLGGIIVLWTKALSQVFPYAVSRRALHLVIPLIPLLIGLFQWFTTLKNFILSVPFGLSFPECRPWIFLGSLLVTSTLLSTIVTIEEAPFDNICTKLILFQSSLIIIIFFISNFQVLSLLGVAINLELPVVGLVWTIAW